MIPLLMLCSLAWAQDSDASDPPEETEGTEERSPWGPAALPAPAIDPTVRVEQRAFPDFDGRPDAKPTLGQSLLWVPRIVLSPIWFVERWVLYPPIRATSIWAEKNNIPVRIVDAVTLYDDKVRLRIYPTALFDFGIRPSVGAYVGLRTKGDTPHDLGLQAAWGGNGWVKAGLSDQVSLAEEETPWEGSEIDLRLTYSDRPDHPFYGLGNATSELESRFSQQEFGGLATATIHFPTALQLDLHAGADHHSFGEGRSQNDDITAISERFDTSALAGFEDGYALARFGAGLVLDTRTPTGARLELAEELAVPLAGLDGALSTVSIDASLFTDLSGRRNSLGVNVHAAQVAATPGEVPFTELITLGGDEHLRGFLEGRFRDGAALTGALQYSYPVWVYADGLLFAEAGGAFPDLGCAALDEMSASFGTGLRTIDDRNTHLQALFALGTTRFEDELAVDSVRFVLGTNRGF